jgi:hypothetical protein
MVLAVYVGLPGVSRIEDHRDLLARADADPAAAVARLGPDNLAVAGAELQHGVTYPAHTVTGVAGRSPPQAGHGSPHALARSGEPPVLVDKPPASRGEAQPDHEQQHACPPRTNRVNAARNRLAREGPDPPGR